MTRLPWLNSLYVLVLVTEAFAASVSHANETKHCDPDKPQNCSQELKLGEQAPFRGQLLTESLAIDLSQKAFWCKQRFQLKFDKETQKLKIELELARQIIEIKAKSHIEAIKHIKESMIVPWYEKPFWVAVWTTTAVILVYYSAKKID